MKKILVNYGGILLFYIIIIFGVLTICTNNTTSKDNSKMNFSASTAFKK